MFKYLKIYNHICRSFSFFFLKIYFLKKIIIIVFFFFAGTHKLFAQEFVFGNPILDEFQRRIEISNSVLNTGWMLRSNSGSPDYFFYPIDSGHQDKKRIELKILPIYLNTRIDGNRPYVGGEYGMIPSRGAQGLLSTGVNARFSFLKIQLQPEFITSQNLPFPGFPDTFSSGTIASRFLYWNVGDSPERFGNGNYSKAFWGQSSVSLQLGSFELGGGTKNFWWGPGQWNSLIFSNNAPGFPFLSLNSTKPAKSFLGNFETQLLIGRLESSNYAASQNNSLNKQYFTDLRSDWRYLNAFMVSYSPKWIPTLTFGYSRTFQFYNSDRPKDLNGWFPIFEPMEKEKLFSNGNSVIYDGERQSQQIAIFGRYKLPKAKAEIYFQFGRRDHALNWREFFLNPEHARAYQLGFLKLSDIPIISKVLQIRGEITHQQESINRNLRYGLFGGTSWHTHGLVRGFTNFGQPLGVGIGTGSNVQTLEISIVTGWDKLGLLFERLENNQDFYNRTFNQSSVKKAWIDWSTALLWNTSYKDLFISARLQGTYARNYQWGLSETSTTEFPVSQNLFSVHSQVNLIYFWGRDLKKEN